MQYTTLGRTGLRVSVAGLGCGSNSRLGLGAGKSEDEATALVRQKEKGKIGHLGITETPPRDPQLRCVLGTTGSIPRNHHGGLRRPDSATHL